MANAALPAIGHRPATTLAHARVTGRPRRPTVFCVAARWPYEQFAEYLRALMAEAGIPDYAELSRLSGVNQTQFSNWRRGISRPSRESLAKVARVVGVPTLNLVDVAGLADDGDEVTEEVRRPAALPAELVELLELWRDERLSDDQRATLLAAVEITVDGMRAQLGRGVSRDGGRPNRGRRAG